MKVKDLIEQLKAMMIDDLDVVVVDHFGKPIPLTKHNFYVYMLYDEERTLVLSVTVPDIGPEPD